MNDEVKITVKTDGTDRNAVFIGSADFFKIENLGALTLVSRVFREFIDLQDTDHNVRFMYLY